MRRTDSAAKFFARIVKLGSGRYPRRTEHGDLGRVAVGVKHLEGIPELSQHRRRDLEIQRSGTLLGKPDDGFENIDHYLGAGGLLLLLRHGRMEELLQLIPVSGGGDCLGGGFFSRFFQFACSRSFLDNPNVAIKPNSNRTYYWLQIFASVLGLALSLYLLVQHTRLKSGIQVSASFCSLGGFADCDVVNVSPISELAGIPLAAIGSVYYFIFLLLGVMAPPGDKNFRFFQSILARLAALGLAIDVVLFFLQIFSLKSLCIMCLGTYLATLLSFAMNVAMAEPTEGDSKLKEAILRPKARSEAKLSGILLSLGVVALASFLLVVTLIPYYIRTNARTYANVEAALEKYYETWKDKPVKTIDVTEGDGTRGNPGARFILSSSVIFSVPFAGVPHSLCTRRSNRSRIASSSTSRISRWTHPATRHSAISCTRTRAIWPAWRIAPRKRESFGSTIDSRVSPDAG